jgi:hypothetical protein
LCQQNLVYEGLPGITSTFTRSAETYSMHGMPYVIVNLKGQSVHPQKPLVSIHVQTPVASEAGPMKGQFLVMLDNAQTVDTIIYLSIGGTAINGKDYQKINKKVTVRAGNLSTAIEIVPIDDAKREKQESVKLTLLSKRFYKLDKIKKATLTITEND